MGLIHQCLQRTVRVHPSNQILQFLFLGMLKNNIKQGNWLLGLISSYGHWQMRPN